MEAQKKRKRKMEAQDARWGKELALTQRNICTIWNREIDTDTFSEKKKQRRATTTAYSSFHLKENLITQIS